MSKWFHWIKTYRTAAMAGLAVFSLLCLWGLFHIKFKESIAVMIPASVQERVGLFQSSPFNSKTFVVVTDKDPALALEGARRLREYLAQKKFISLPPVQGAQFGLSLAKALPYRFTEKDSQEALKFITPQVISAQMRDNFQNLMSFQGSFLKEMILLDPLGLSKLMGEKLKAFDVTSSMEYADGFLISKDHTAVIGIYEAAFNPADISASTRFKQAFQQARQENVIPHSSRAFYLGAARYTQENSFIVRQDLKVISVLALVGLGALFMVFFRRKRALWIFALPFFVLAPSALVTYLVFGEISGITLGFGSVVAGLAVDYSIYMYFALCGSSKAVLKTARKLLPHLLYSYATSVACFAALLFSSIELFKQIAVFSIAGLTFALLLAVFVFPAFWKKLPPAPIVTLKKLPPLRRTAAAVILCILLWGGMAGALRLQISGNLDSLNSVSDAFTQDKALFDKAFSQQTAASGLLFVFGDNQDLALKNNEKVSRHLGRDLAVSLVYPSEYAKDENLVRWRKFWAQNGEKTRELVRQNALHWGLKPGAFKPFEYLTSLVQDPDSFDFSAFYNPFTQISGGYAVVNMVPDSPAFNQLDVPGVKTVFVSAEVIRQDLIAGVRTEAVKILLVTLFLVGGLILYFFKNLRDTLLTFIPVAGAFSFTFLVFWLAGIQVNLFILAFLPLLTGLGVDYGLFQVIKHRAGHNSVLYPQNALVAASLSTFIGFGVLALAEHNVLFIIGLSACLGIAGAALSALFLLPPLLEAE
ncbi:MMPL family transporter [Candidatus Avelusimicrobium aviculae]|uniref:MMPL family transporter n=1 Tax=Candidatus Avelusimicrobium aviculae TaxID=3416206 RepID=UPI003D100B88